MCITRLSQNHPCSHIHADAPLPPAPQDLVEAALVLVRQRAKERLTEQLARRAEDIIVRGLVGPHAAEDVVAQFKDMYRKGEGRGGGAGRGVAGGQVHEAAAIRCRRNWAADEGFGRGGRQRSSVNAVTIPSNTGALLILFMYCANPCRPL